MVYLITVVITAAQVTEEVRKGLDSQCVNSVPLYPFGDSSFSLLSLALNLMSSLRITHITQGGFSQGLKVL